MFLHFSALQNFHLNRMKAIDSSALVTPKLQDLNQTMGRFHTSMLEPWYEPDALRTGMDSLASKIQEKK